MSEDGHNVPIAKDWTKGCSTSLGLLQNLGPGKADSEAWGKKQKGIWDIFVWFVVPTATAPVVMMTGGSMHIDAVCLHRKIFTEMQQLSQLH